MAPARTDPEPGCRTKAAATNYGIVWLMEPNKLVVHDIGRTRGLWWHLALEVDDEVQQLMGV